MRRWWILLVAIGAAACRDAPSDAELTRLHDEAVRANADELARQPASHEPGSSLTVSGELGKPAATLGWPELQQLATTHVRTINIQNADKKTPTDFRGVLVRDLLDRFAASPTATEATMVAADGFRATISIADARRYRMLLAIDADGAPIPRSAGGPIFLVHPFSENGPELAARYPDRFWAFYVTHLIVGSEPAQLDVGGKLLDRAALDQLPVTSFDGPVGWKVDWPADTVHLRGVALVDAIKASYGALPAAGQIVIRGKAPVHDDPQKPIAIDIADLARCKPLLALRYGADDALIPAKLGGPIALAITPCGQAYGDRLWVTFVEHVEVRPQARASGAP